jgi:peptide deformylase
MRGVCRLLHVVGGRLSTRGLAGISLVSLPPPPQVLQLGNPLLKIPSEPIIFDETSLGVVELELHSALAEFRRVQGFGRAISAPQIGHNVRMIACNLGTTAVHRPEGK